MIRTAIFAVLALVCATLPSEARQRHSVASCIETGGIMSPVCGTAQAGFLTGVRSINVEMKRERRHRVQRAPEAAYGSSTQIVAHPASCPRTAFCGCGASVRVFGRSVRDLWLAANWFKFPRAAPAAGMVAVRRHHVFVLEAHIGGDTWQVYDANSGRHATRIHARSIAGYAIVNPHGAG